MKFSMESPHFTGSLATAGINGVINGLIAWSGFKDSESIALSMDSIGTPGITALGNAAMLAFGLTLIISCITFFVFRRSARKSGMAPAVLNDMPFFPTGLKIALGQTLLVFGAFVTCAVLWQRAAGTVMVPPATAALLVAAIAVLASGIAEWRTKCDMLARAKANPAG